MSGKDEPHTTDQPPPIEPEHPSPDAGEVGHGAETAQHGTQEAEEMPLPEPRTERAYLGSGPINGVSRCVRF